MCSKWEQSKKREIQCVNKNLSTIHQWIDLSVFLNDFFLFSQYYTKRNEFVSIFVPFCIEFTLSFNEKWNLNIFFSRSCIIGCILETIHFAFNSDGIFDLYITLHNFVVLLSVIQVFRLFIVHCVKIFSIAKDLLQHVNRIGNILCLWKYISNQVLLTDNRHRLDHFMKRNTTQPLWFTFR